MARIFTVDQAADYLHVTPYTIRKWLRAGRIPGRKIGRVYRILEADIMALLGNVSPEADADVVEIPLSAEEGRRKRAEELLGKFAHHAATSDDLIRNRREEVARDERRWKRRLWEGMTKEQKWEHLGSLKGKYADLSFSSDDLARERREESEREERKWRR